MNFVGIQSLRAYAAMLVVLHHATQMVHQRLGVGQEWTFGAAGVDLFFPISGFVMAVTTYRYWGRAGQARTFLLRRLIRIVPLYWAATLIKLLALLAVPALSSRPELDAWHVMASFLFIPAWDSYHRAQPLVVAGWTLHYEMLFYVLFAAALALRCQPVLWVGAVLAAVCFLPLEPVLGAVGTLADPILLEFVAGMLLGWAACTGRAMDVRVAPWCLLLALLVLPMTEWFQSSTALHWRAALWGIPGALALAAVVAMEPKIATRLKGWPAHLGDASYAIYLVHGFVLPPLGMILARLQWTGTLGATVAVVGGCVASAVAGLVVHRHAERPVTQWLNTRLRGRLAVA